MPISPLKNPAKGCSLSLNLEHSKLCLVVCVLLAYYCGFKAFHKRESPVCMYLCVSCQLLNESRSHDAVSLLSAPEWLVKTSEREQWQEGFAEAFILKVDGVKMKMGGRASFLSILMLLCGCRFGEVYSWVAQFTWLETQLDFGQTGIVD